METIPLPSIVLLVVCLVGLTVGAHVTSVPVPFSVSDPVPAIDLINVRTDFNASGDGMTDDYVQLQAAIDYARK